MSDVLGAVDVHAHFWTDEYLDFMERLGRRTAQQRGRGGGGGAELTARLELMDRASVQTQVLSATPMSPYGTDENLAVAAARSINDTYHELAAAHPHRFALFASLPLPHLDASLAELGRAFDELGAVGIAVNTWILDTPLTDARFAPLFEELNRRAATVFIHPTGNALYCDAIRENELTWMIGAPLEDTVSAALLIHAGYPSRYPHITFINSHLGGALPMLLQRMDNKYQSEWQDAGAAEAPSVAARRMYFDTVGHHHVPALRAAADTFGADRLLLGTDFPLVKDDTYVKSVEYIGTTLDEAAASAVLNGNFARLQRRRDTDVTAVGSVG